MRLRRRRRSQAGFTLIELMISLVLFSFAVAGVLAVAVAMASGFREQKNTIGAEGSARAGMEFLTDAVRGAAPGVVNANSGTLEALATCAVGAFSVTNSVTLPDRLTLVFAYGSVVTSSLGTYAAGQSSLDVVDATQFSQDDYVLISNYAQGHIVRVASVTDADTIALDTTVCGPTVTFPNGGTAYGRNSLVIRVARAEFFVQDLDGVPTLWMDPDAEGAATAEPLAEGVEDLQVSLGVDPNGDGIFEDTGTTDGDEWSFNTPNAAELPPAATEQIRGVKLTLVARTPGPSTGLPSFYRPPALDRLGSAVADNFRRRVHTSVIEIRNAGGSP